MLHDSTPEMQMILHSILKRVGEQQSLKDDAYEQRRAMLDAQDLAAEAARIDAAVRALRTKSASSGHSASRSAAISAESRTGPLSAESNDSL